MLPLLYELHCVDYFPCYLGCNYLVSSGVIFTWKYFRKPCMHAVTGPYTDNAMVTTFLVSLHVNARTLRELCSCFPTDDRYCWHYTLMVHGPIRVFHDIFHFVSHLFTYAACSSVTYTCTNGNFAIVILTSAYNALQCLNSLLYFMRLSVVAYTTYYNPVGDPPYFSSVQGGGLIMRSWLIII